MYLFYICCSVAESCPVLCDPMDCSPPGSSAHGIFQARILQWVAISFSRGSSWIRDQTHVSCIGRWILYHWATREALIWLLMFWAFYFFQLYWGILDKYNCTYLKYVTWWFHFKRPYCEHLGLPRWLSAKESACQCRRHGFDPWVGRIPWRRKCQPTPVFLPGKSHGQRSLAGYSPWDCRVVFICSFPNSK